MEEYNKQAEKFLKDTKTTLSVEFLKHGLHFESDTDERDIYSITLKRGDREFKFNFGQCLAESGFKLINSNTKQEAVYTWFNELTFNKDRDKEKLRKDMGNKFGFMVGLPSRDNLKIVFGGEPKAYDILACLTSSEVGTLKDFCDNFGYNEDSIKAEKTYKAVLNEWENLKMLYSDEELNQLAEIQ